MSGHLLVVTSDGYAKRVDPDDIPLTARGRKGAKLSSTQVAAVLEVDPGDDVVIATATGKVARFAVSAAPQRTRRVEAGGRMSKGARLVELADGDRIASAGVAETPPTGTDQEAWPWGKAGLRRGERIDSWAVFHPPTPLESITPGGEPAVPRSEWSKTEIHNASTYSRAHCGRDLPDPHAVYQCIDRHVEATR